ncbi:MAG: nucleoside diphosphate kinase regulator [Burkholderiaceae bacterium]
MGKHPSITISSLDYERLSELLASQPNKNTAAIATLQSELDRAHVVEPAEMPPDVVSMNSRVSFAMEPGDKRFEMELVYPRDADGSVQRISVLAPVGAALLGLSVGQRIEWPAPDGKSITVRILEVTYQPERAGVLHR